MLRRLDELSNDELKHEFVKAGLEGEYEEALMVVKMTIYIVKVLKKDHFSFKFVVNEEDMECAAVSSSWLADGLSCCVFARNSVCASCFFFKFER